MDDKYEKWLLKAVNEVLSKTRDCVARLEELDERMARVEDSLARPGRASPGAETMPLPGREDEPGLEPEPADDEFGAAAGLAGGAGLGAALGASAGKDIGLAPEYGSDAGGHRASSRRTTLAKPDKPTEVEGPEEIAEKSAEELRAAFDADPGHCPQCGVRLKRKAVECRKCGLLLPKRGSLFKKLLVTLLVLVLLLGGAGVGLHFTGHLPGVLGKIPWVKDNIPAFLTPPATESGPPTTESAPPVGGGTETAPPTSETTPPAKP